MCDPPAPPPSSPFDAGPPGRRHSLPPPPGGERADLLLLDEHPPELGMALWQLLRGARLWGAREGHDPTLFDLPGPIDATCRAAADAAPEIAAALAVLLGLLRAPHHAQRAEVAEACRAVLEWATARGAGETAFQAAEIVAVVLPTDARACADAGKACARIGERSRAIAWYQRAIVLARRAGEWRWYVTTLLRHGYALVEVGRLDLAKRMFERAWRTAKRKG